MQDHHFVNGLGWDALIALGLIAIPAVVVLVAGGFSIKWAAGQSVEALFAVCMLFAALLFLAVAMAVHGWRNLWGYGTLDGKWFGKADEPIEFPRQ